jgi:membrane protein YdbS with pleckstrin-like domain
LDDETDAPLPVPTRRLPASARTYWAASAALGAVVPLIGAIAIGTAVGGALIWLLPLLVLAAALVAIFVLPPLRYRRWRYEVRDEEIDIQHGTFVVKRTLVPIRRVQHVETETGPLQSSFELASVAFHTAAGETEIPALSRAEAEHVRARIARLARGLDDV